MLVLTLILLGTHWHTHPCTLVLSNTKLDLKKKRILGVRLAVVAKYDLSGFSVLYFSSIQMVCSLWPFLTTNHMEVGFIFSFICPFIHLPKHQLFFHLSAYQIILNTYHAWGLGKINLSGLEVKRWGFSSSSAINSVSRERRKDLFQITR